MTYTAPVAEQRFVLDHIVRVGELAARRFAAATPTWSTRCSRAIGAVRGGRMGAARPRRRHRGRALDSRRRRACPPGYAAAYQAYVEGGWGTIGVPEEFGGQGLPFAIQCAVLETLGSANMGFALAPILTVGAIEALAHHGTPEQQRTYLPKLATGEWTGTMNLTEPQAGSDVGALRVDGDAARRRDVRDQGTKIFICFGDHDLTDNIVHLVLARTPDAPAGTRGISLFLVPKVGSDGTPQRRPRRLDRAQDGAARLAHLRAELRRSRRLHRRADRPRIWRHARDVHDDEQCAAERRASGRAGRRGRDAEGGRLCARAGPGRARRRARARSSSIPTYAAC